MQETRVRSPGWEDPLEKEMATHSSILSWKISWTEEPGGLQSVGLQRVGDCKELGTTEWLTLTYLACYKACPGKSLKLTLSMSLKYTANFAWDLSLWQIRTSSKEKGGQRDILNLKQKTIKSQSVCLDLCMCQCMSFVFFSDKIVEVVNEF